MLKLKPQVCINSACRMNWHGKQGLTPAEQFECLLSQQRAPFSLEVRVACLLCPSCPFSARNYCGKVKTANLLRFRTFEDLQNDCKWRFMQHRHTVHRTASCQDHFDSSEVDIYWWHDDAPDIKDVRLRRGWILWLHYLKVCFAPQTDE